MATCTLRRRRCRNAIKRRPSARMLTVAPSRIRLILLIFLILTISELHTTFAAVSGRMPFLSKSLMRIGTSKLLKTQTNSISQSLLIRGGATIASPEDEDDELLEESDESNDIRQHPEFEKLQSYRMRQQALLQFRGTLLSEALVKRGIPLPSLQDAATPEGKITPKKVDWECILVSKENNLECMYTLASEPGTKLIAPTDPKETSEKPKDGEWVSVVVLNRLRRKDPTKVDGMWHNKYAIMDSWFKADSEFSILQHIGVKGVVLNFVLNDTILTMLIASSIVIVLVALMPLWEALLNRFLVSGLLWSKWITWGRFVHLGLPFKLMVAQWMFGTVNKAFKKLKENIKEILEEIESENLDKTLPLTLEVATPAHVEERDAEILPEEDEIMEHLIEVVEDEEEDDSETDDEESEEED